MIAPPGIPGIPERVMPSVVVSEPCIIFHVSIYENFIKLCILYKLFFRLSACRWFFLSRRSAAATWHNTDLFRQAVLMFSGFNNLASLKYIYFISIHNSRKPVGYKYCDVIGRSGNIPYRLADFVFCQRIKRRSSFVKNQQTRFSEQSSSQ